MALVLRPALLRPSFARVPTSRRPAVVRRFREGQAGVSVDATHSLWNHDAPASLQQCVFSTAQRDLKEYCSTMSNQDASCWELHDWFVQRCEDIECSLASAAGGPEAADQCQRMHQTLVELLSCGNVEQIYKSLKIMKQLEARKGAAGNTAPATAALSPAPSSGSSSSSSSGTLDAEARELLAAVFRKADANSNGHLSWSEFHSALGWLGDDLSEDELELVSSTLDLQGSVTLDQFLAIVEQAEAARAVPSADARFLAHLTHHHPAERDHLSQRLA